MHYHIIGQIKGAKVVTRKDKTTQAMVANCEIIVQYEDYDKNGELVLATQNIQFPSSEVENFKSNLNKFIVIPHVFISSPKGAWVLPDENMNYTIFETNPLVQNNDTKTTDSKKAS